MTTRMMVTALFVLLATGHAWAISDENDFGMVGIVAGQMARLNVVNTMVDPGARPCMVKLSFFDSAGGLLGGPDTRVLRAREAAFADFDPRLDPIPHLRLQFRAQVSVGGDNPRERRGCSNNLIPTLEIFNTETGQTQILYPGVIKGFNPQPDPPGGQ